MAIPYPQPGSAALITGASSGIGAEIARQLGARGHDLVLIARRREKLEELAGELRGQGRRVEVVLCDVSEGESRKTCFAEVDALGLDIEVLVLSAGFGMGGPFINQDPDRIDLMVRTNLGGVYAFAHHFVHGMVERRRGAIMFVASLAGRQPMPNFNAYGGTKAAVTNFSQALGEELREYGITCTALCPGGVRTEFAEVAQMENQEKDVPDLLLIGPEECARAGIAGLEAGTRVVTPRRVVQAFTWFGRNAPRSVWLPICKRLLAGSR